jgi:hypothetical protein
VRYWTICSYTITYDIDWWYSRRITQIFQHEVIKLWIVAMFKRMKANRCSQICPKFA